MTGANDMSNREIQKAAHETNDTTTNTTPHACARCATSFGREDRVYTVPAAPGIGRVGVPYGTLCEVCFNMH